MRTIRSPSKVRFDGRQYEVLLILEPQSVLLNVNGERSAPTLFSAPVFPSSDQVFIGIILASSPFVQFIFSFLFLTGGAPSSNVESYTGGLYSQNFYGCIHTITFQVRPRGQVARTRPVSLAGDTTDNTYALKDEQCSDLKRTSLAPIVTRPPFITTTTTKRADEPIQCNDGDTVTLSGQGYIKLKNKVITRQDPTTGFDIKFEVDNSASSGLLLWQGLESQDWISISVVGGKVEFAMKSSMTGDKVLITNPKQIDDGNSYFIQASKASNEVELVVGNSFGKDRVSARIPEGFKLDRAQDGPGVYIGKTPPFYDDTAVDSTPFFPGGVSAEASPSSSGRGFNGCIASLQISNSKLGVKFGAKLIPTDKRYDSLLIERRSLTCAETCLWNIFAT